MSRGPQPQELDRKTVLKLYKSLGSVQKVAELIGFRKRVQKIVRDAIAEGEVDKLSKPGPEKKERATKSKEPVILGTPQPETWELLRPHKTRKGVARYICTEIQEDTDTSVPTKDVLLSLAKKYDARLIVSHLYYDRHGTGKERASWFDPDLEQYVLNRNVRLAPDLAFFGDWKTIPTAQKPLQGLDGHTRGGSGIYPHHNLAMNSLLRIMDEKPRYSFTTGTMSQINYRPGKAGSLAQFNHTNGGLLVEVEGDKWWARQLNVDVDTQSVFDLDLHATPDKVEGGHRCVTLTPGDIHHEAIDEVFWAAVLELIDFVKPNDIFLHDLLDFGRRNHHDENNHFHNLELALKNRECVGEEVRNAAAFLTELSRLMVDYNGDRWGRVNVVDSNHDLALERWIKRLLTKGIGGDATNMEFYGEMVRRASRAKRLGEEYHTFEDACRLFEENPHFLGEFDGEIDLDGVSFLPNTKSFNIMGIEYSQHGHIGANGARSGKAAAVRSGAKTTTGHTHSPAIEKGSYVVGATAKLDQGYNRGGWTSWDHSVVIADCNGKRQSLSATGEDKRLYARRP